MNKDTVTISVILPVLNEQEVLEKAVQKISAQLESLGISYEIVIVDDGSTDSTWDIIEKIQSSNRHVGALRFTRNFGKEAAMAAGLSHATGKAAVIMDADLQHPPELLPRMIGMWRDHGFKIVQGVKESRPDESMARRLGAKAFYWIMSRSSGYDLSQVTDFVLLDQSVIRVYLKLPERNLFLKGLLLWSGFERAVIPFRCTQGARQKSRWTLSMLFRQAVHAVTAFSALPLQLVTAAGITTFIFSMALAIHTLYKKATGQAVEGFTTVILLLLIIGSVLMISLGIIGLYLERIFTEIKKRPRYLVRDTLFPKKGS